MLKITKQDIFHLPIAHWHDLSLNELSNTLEAQPLKFASAWLLPQLVNWFGTWKICNTARDTVVTNCDTELKRTLYMLSRVSRSNLVTKQVSAPDYSKLTPLIMLGIRNVQGISYQRQRDLFPDLHYVLEPDLLNAVVLPEQVVGDVYSLGSERLLSIRNQGLMTASGKTAGISKNPETTWNLSGIKNTEIGELPKLAQSILCQVWLAHPRNRRSSMILDLRNWDNMPDPLVTQELFVSEPKPAPKPKFKYDALPWDPA